MVIQKTKPTNSGTITKTTSDERLRFSFAFFDNSDSEICPKNLDGRYTHALMERLKSFSTWTVTEFVNSREKATRIHCIVWTETSRPNGFEHLNASLRDEQSWQFAISANEYGRVHGLIIGGTFYIIWLDQNHTLYAGRA